MKPGSYPVINPDGIPFPKTFLNISRPAMQELVLQTDVTSNYINLTSPTPGDWFALAFISWSDPNKDRIQQEGNIVTTDQNGAVINSICTFA